MNPTEDIPSSDNNEQNLGLNPNVMNPDAPTDDSKRSDLAAENGTEKRKLIVLILAILLTLTAILLVRQFFDFGFFVERESILKEYYAAHPLICLSIAFLIYVAVAGLNIPIALLLSLTYAWFFGFVPAVVLISFASTAGATVAFLVSRYALRDLIQNKFGDRLRLFNEALEKEGSFYLFSLRLVPLVPFSVINAVMGLTKMKASTFWWVSQIGMLPGTAVFVYAGSRIPDLKTLNGQGYKAVISPTQLTQITIALALVGVLPLIVKRLLEWRRKKANLN